MTKPIKEEPDNGADRPRAKRGLDRELQAMARIDRILADLTQPEVDRVLTWLVSKHDCLERWEEPTDDDQCR